MRDVAAEQFCHFLSLFKKIWKKGEISFFNLRDEVWETLKN